MKKQISILALSAVLSLGLVACSPNENSESTVSSSTESLESVETVAEIQTMEGSKLDEIMEDAKKKEDYLVIDVRSQDEYNLGHVKYAININVDELESNLDKIASYKDKNVVTICNSGKKSQKAAEILVNNNFTKVFNAQGVKEFEYTSMSKIENILGADLQAIADNESENYTIIDARDAKDYEAGHLKGAINIRVDDLESQLENISKDKAIVTYCYSGNKSTAIAQKLVDAGYENVKNSNDGTKEFDYTFEK